MLSDWGVVLHFLSRTVPQGYMSHLILFVCFQSAQSLHGDIPQKQRETTLKGFRNGTFEVLVATNVAARGLDIPEVDLVIQCSPPKVGCDASN